MEKIEFRFALPEDLEEIVRIYNSTIPSRLVTADLNPVSVESKKAWFENHKQDHPLFVVVQNLSIVGWFGFQPYHTRPAYSATQEISIYLDEKIRGQGIGKKVLKHIITLAPNYHVENIVGLIFDHNLASLKLFKTEGFEIWGHLPNVANLDGIKRGLIIVGKSV